MSGVEWTAIVGREADDDCHDHDPGEFEPGRGPLIQTRDFFFFFFFVFPMRVSVSDRCFHVGEAQNLDKN